MLCYLVPYIAVGMIVTVATAIAYSAGVIGLAGLYGLALAASFIVVIGGARWEQRRQPHRR